MPEEKHDYEVKKTEKINLKEICNDVLGPIQVETLALYPGHTTHSLMQDIYLSMQEAVDRAVDHVFSNARQLKTASEVKNLIKKPKK